MNTVRLPATGAGRSVAQEMHDWSNHWEPGIGQDVREDREWDEWEADNERY